MGAFIKNRNADGTEARVQAREAAPQLALRPQQASGGEVMVALPAPPQSLQPSCVLPLVLGTVSMAWRAPLPQELSPQRPLTEIHPPLVSLSLMLQRPREG